MNSNDMIDWISGLKAGDEIAARKIWEAYEKRVAGLVRNHLPAAIGADPSQIVVDVFDTVFRRVRVGLFKQLETHGHLKAWLFSIAFCKASRAFQKALRAPHAADESERVQFEVREALPSEEAIETQFREAEEVLAEFLRKLKVDDPEGHEILMLRLAHPSLGARDIATRLRIPVARVVRKLEYFERVLKSLLIEKKP